MVWGDGRAAAARRAFDENIVFNRDRHAIERRQGLAHLPAGFGLLGCAQHLFIEACDERIDLRLKLIAPRQMVLGDLHRRQGFGAIKAGKLGGRQFRDIHDHSLNYITGRPRC